MLENVTSGIVAVIKDENIKELSKNGIQSFVLAVLKKDMSSLLNASIDTARILWEIPNAIYWDKMYRFMTGTFLDFDAQVKMCSKFNNDERKTKAFVKKQLQIIEKIDFDCKIDWLSNLTRAFLLELLNEQEYFKLAFAIVNISAEDLEYITKVEKMKNVPENGILNAFYLHSLVDKYTPNSCGAVESEYNISELGKKFVKLGLNFENLLP